LEIERKFLINKPLWEGLPKPEGTYFRQGYLSTDPAKTIRVRMAGDKGFLTIKGKTVGISRSEWEYPIPTEDAQALLDELTETTIEKRRYVIEFAGKQWEVDEFFGDNEGLLLAELELASEDEPFELPPWIGQEVSEDVRYFNASLSKHPYKSWREL
jgi:adenylate cyclase